MNHLVRLLKVSFLIVGLIVLSWTPASGMTGEWRSPTINLSPLPWRGTPLQPRPENALGWNGLGAGPAGGFGLHYHDTVGQKGYQTTVEIFDRYYLSPPTTGTPQNTLAISYYWGSYQAADYGLISASAGVSLIFQNGYEKVGIGFPVQTKAIFIPIDTFGLSLSALYNFNTVDSFWAVLASIEFGQLRLPKISQ